LDIGAAGADLIGINDQPHIRVDPQGILQIVDSNDNVLHTSTQRFVHGRWHTVFMIREDRGAGLKTYYRIDDVDPIFETTTNHIANYSTNRIDLGRRDAGSFGLTMSNVKLKLDGVVHIREELAVSGGVFIPTSGVVFGTSREQV